MKRQAPFFTRRVTELKAWQLYTGQSVWFFFIGIIFYILKRILDMTFLKDNVQFQSAYTVAENIGSGQARPDDGAQFAEQFML